ncbi:MAG TPA: helix-turn-helix transcriptional regulator [Pseudonocardiaceae bacterium]|nr:helix-turn-helix transcriptional regulator [Pseudonocardiaceae bacterium]
MAESSVIRRIHIGVELEAYRKAAGWSREQTAELLDCSLSKITKIENGDVAVKRAELLTMLEAYKAPEKQREELLQVAREAKNQQPLSMAGVAAPFRKARRLEAAASQLASFVAELVPGLLQTEDYMRAVIAAVSPDLPDDEVEARVRVRTERQNWLMSDRGPLLRAVLSEGAIRRLVGGKEVMRKQLLHLVEMEKRANIDFQVLPFSAGAHAAIGFTFTLMRFSSDSAPSTVYLEDLTTATYLDKPRDVDVYKVTFDRLQQVALSPADSVAMLETVLGELE